jgi:hypothetical protein
VVTASRTAVLSIITGGEWVEMTFPAICTCC